MEVAAAHIVLLIVVTADPSSAVVSRAAGDALAAPFTEPPRVLIRTMTAAPAPSAVATLASDNHADAVVILTCAGTGCASAEVRVERGGRDPTARAVRFGARDALGERGRAIGLLASTLLPESWNRTAPPPSTEAAPPPAPVRPAVTTVVATSATGPPPAALHWSVEALGAFLDDPSADGGSDLGLTLAASRTVANGWAVRLGLKLERGDLPSSAGTVRAIGGVAGLQWTSAGLREPGQFGWGARADFVALARQVLPALDREADDLRTNLALGADAVALVGFALSRRAALIADAGVEVLGSIGRSGDDPAIVPNPPAFRLLGEVGIVTRF